VPHGLRNRTSRHLLLPSWILGDHPLYLSAKDRAVIRKEFDPRGIFLNIPYSARYSDLEVAILSTVTAYGMTPRMARERLPMQIRVKKSRQLILSCRYGLTDLSYATRMNMPLELGFILALGKESFVMSRRPYSALRSISDLNFCDVHYHKGAIRAVSSRASPAGLRGVFPRRFILSLCY
jgi:hypothetical protein